jgi:hypothetical protein
MRYCLYCLLSLILSGTLLSQRKSGAAVLKKMHDKYYHGICRAYTFSQRNTHYRNDSVVGHSVWHEAIEFPDKFWIDFGEKNGNNFVLFRNDSMLRSRNGIYVKMRPDSSTLLLLLGGMYYRDLKDVTARLNASKYDLQKMSEQKWHGSSVLVLGAEKGDTLSNQFWIDKKTMNVLRIIEKSVEGQMLDMRFESHQPWCKGFVENKVSFRRNGRLEQVEEYYDLKIEN